MLQYTPVQILIDLIKFILLLSPSGTSSYLIDSLIQTLDQIAAVNMMHRFKRHSPSELNPDLDTKECLRILHIMAYDCIHDQQDLERFWRCMQFNSVVMMLNIAQPISELHLALSLLQTSVLEESFAMIVPPGDGDQRKSQEHVIEPLSRLLVQGPQTQDNSTTHDPIEIAKLRLATLDLMESMCSTTYGGQALANHRDVIGRLVWLMNDELAALYDYDHARDYRYNKFSFFLYSILQSTHPKLTSIRAELVNRSTRLLFHLTNVYSDLIDLQSKLCVIPGGTHKHLIALTRLAFTENLFYEANIEEDVADCAHQMLEALVNPQEAEALMEAFSSAKN